MPESAFSGKEMLRRWSPVVNPLPFATGTRDMSFIEPSSASYLTGSPYISSVFEAVLHYLSRNVMEKYIHTIVKFFTAGAYQVLGL